MSYKLKKHSCWNKLSDTVYGQATKGIRWMPWYQEAMKDVVSCDKPWGAAKQA
jgi:hypothetical protein